MYRNYCSRSLVTIITGQQRRKGSNIILVQCTAVVTGAFNMCTECFKRNVSENANGSYKKTNNARRVKICVWQP